MQKGEIFILYFYLSWLKGKPNALHLTLTHFCIRPASDVAISGLGWISVEPIRRTRGSELRNLDDSEHEIRLCVSVPKPVEVFLRPTLPIGTSGAEWYQYRELTDKEEEGRPKWYF